MLTENDIISLLTVHLKSAGYKILQSRQTHEQRVDIIADNSKHVLYVEAKGETSSKDYSSRFGNSFDSNQIKSHVSRAILTSMMILHGKPIGTKTKTGIALPDTKGHRELIVKITHPLKTLGIKVFFVSAIGVHEL